MLSHPASQSAVSHHLDWVSARSIILSFNLPLVQLFDLGARGSNHWFSGHLIWEYHPLPRPNISGTPVMQDYSHVGTLWAKKGCASVFRHFEHEVDICLGYSEMHYWS